MRILTYSFFSILFLMITGLVLFVMAQEVLVFWGNQTIRSALFDLGEKPHESVCQDYLDDFTEDSVRETYQLRFINDSEFVSEVKCSPFESNVTVIDEHQLPPFVTKIPGSSGILWEDEPSGLGITAFASVYKFLNDQLSINLKALSKEKYLTAEGKTLTESREMESFGKSPIAACESFGYQCCDTVSEQGEGENITKVASCQQNCYARCVSRPLVLNFMSEPFPDLDLRQLEVTADTSVLFHYLVDVQGDARVDLDFGDGTQESFKGESGSTSHQFECRLRRCEYTVFLTAYDQDGRTSATTALSSLKIIVTP